MSYGKENVRSPHTLAYSCSFTLHTPSKNGMRGQRGEGCQNAIFFYKSSLVANFLQTCSLISMHNVMYTVCSSDTPL